MKKKVRFRQFLSGVMAVMTILSTTLSPLSAYAAEPEKKEIEYEQQKKSLMEDIHFNIIFKRIYIRRWLRDREFDEEEIRR